jgi:phosphomannomutase
VVRVSVADVMARSGVKFGTSGARGLVTDLTDRVAYVYTAAFLQHLKASGQLGAARAVTIAGDLRPSTPRILRAVGRAVADCGLAVDHAGEVPSPAAMLYAVAQGWPSIMVTGSHIPDDRNGIKFNGPKGEITKQDEQGIREQVVELPALFDDEGYFEKAHVRELPPVNPAARALYKQRFTSAFPRALAGVRVGVYGHSAVGRELMVEVLGELGAEVVRLGWSDRFVPVDTEAIRPEDRELAAAWAREHGLFAIVSTDGDSDRPLVADERGLFFRGDTACLLVARYLGAVAAAAPVSCNTALERSGWFKATRTRIGSPFVIEAMVAAVAAGETRVVGYEANGGFLQATKLDVPGGGELASLPTRDAIVVHLSLLLAALAKKTKLSGLLDELPQRFTDSDRLEHFPTERGQAIVSELIRGGAAGIARSFPELGAPKDFDTVDGLRVQFESGEVLHVRPSGNAPELRCYVEAANEARAKELLRYGLAVLGAQRG